MSADRSAPGSRSSSPVTTSCPHASQRVGAGPGHRQCRRRRGGQAIHRREDMAEAVVRQGQRLADRGGDAAEHRARTRDRHLLPDDRPHQRLGRVDRAGDPQTGPRLDQSPASGRHATAPRRRTAGRRRGPADAGCGRPRERDRASRRAGTRRRRDRRRQCSSTVPCPCGRASVRRVCDAVVALDARHGAIAQELEQLPAGERLACRQTHRDGAGIDRRRTSRCVRWRRSLGAAAYTSRTVSLNWRTLPKPAAKAMSVMPRSVVSISVRAVCARWARASASGPAPSSSVRIRLRWRTL